MSYYGVSHWSVARDDSGKIGRLNVGIMAYYWISPTRAYRNSPTSHMLFTEGGAIIFNFNL